MAKFTLFEVHLEDASFTANAPYSGKGSEGSESDSEDEYEEEDEEEEEGAAADSGSGGPGRALVGLLVVVAILALAYLGSRRLGGDDVPDVAVEEELEA